MYAVYKKIKITKYLSILCITLFNKINVHTMMVEIKNFFLKSLQRLENYVTTKI